MLERTNTLEHGHKLLGKNRWKPAFLSREGRTDKEAKGQDEQWKNIDDFLHKTSPKEDDPGDGPRPNSQSEDGVASVIVLNVLSLEEQHRINHPARKPPRLRGLSVAFSTEAPEIIGEGGDEASSPSIAISKHPKSRSNMKTSFDNARSKSHSKQDLSPLRDTGSVSKVMSLSPLSWSSKRITPTAAEERNTVHDGQQMAAKDSKTESKQESPRAVIVKESGQSLDLSLNPRLGDFSPDITSAVQTRDLYISPVKPSCETPTISTTKSLPPNVDGKDPVGANARTMPAKMELEKPVSDMSIDCSTPGKENTEPTLSSAGQVMAPTTRALKTAARSPGSDALTDFSLRVYHLYQLFELGMNSLASKSDCSFDDWIRAAVWWFLRGRKELEEAVRTKSYNIEKTSQSVAREPTVELRQAYLDLAKAWWIVMEIVPNDKDFLELSGKTPMTTEAMAKRFGNCTKGEYAELYLRLKSCMRGLAVSMKRNDRLPPSSLEATRLNLSLWTGNSDASQETEQSVLRKLLQTAQDDAKGSLKHFHSILGDTEEYFNYGSMFVDLQLRQDDGKDQGDDQLHCVLTIMRKKGEFGLQARVSSQTGSFSFAITGNGASRPNWEDFRWHTRQHILSLKANDGKVIEFSFFEKDFKALWSAQEHSVKVQRSMDQAKCEQQLCMFRLQNFHHVSTPPNVSFPGEPLKDCTVRLFESWKESHEGMGMRQIHSGVRLHVTSPPNAKVLSYLTFSLDQESPILFSYMRGEAGAPALLLKLRSGQQDSKWVLTFQTREDRSLFHAYLDGTLMTNDESCSESIPLEAAAQSRPSSSASTVAFSDNFLDSIPWQRLRVIARSTKGSSLAASQATLPPTLRIWAECPFGSLVDRIDVGPGALTMSLNIEAQTELRLRWPEQGDSTVSFSNGQLTKDQVDALRKCLQNQNVSAGVAMQKSRTYRFSLLEDLHRFQVWVTGHRPVFDGLAAGFSVSRRRMVVPLYKRLESTLTRLQVLTQGKITQLLAFFKDLPLGTCMCFVLKSTDKYESFSRSGQFYVRMVDAKFALPRSTEEDNHDFIALDTPEYATEHDDILIAFDTEEGEHINISLDTNRVSADCYIRQNVGSL